MYYMKSASYEYRKYSAKIEAQWTSITTNEYVHRTKQKRDNFENRVVFTKEDVSFPETDICIYVGHSFVMKQS